MWMKSWLEDSISMLYTFYSMSWRQVGNKDLLYATSSWWRFQISLLLTPNAGFRLIFHHVSFHTTRFQLVNIKHVWYLGFRTGWTLTHSIPLRSCLQIPHTPRPFWQIICSHQPRIGNTLAVVGRAKLGPKSDQLSSGVSQHYLHIQQRHCNVSIHLELCYWLPDEWKFTFTLF